MRAERSIFWACLIGSAAAHALVVVGILLAAPIVPPRPHRVVIGISSMASRQAPAIAKTDPPLEDKKAAPVDSVAADTPSPPVQGEEMLPPPEKAPRPKPPPPPVKTADANVHAGSVASAESQASSGALVDRLPEGLPTNPAPDYPDEARRSGWEGRVVLRVLVSADGTVAAIAVHKSSGRDILDRAALEAVRRWGFVPGRRGDQPIAREIGVPVDFRLRETRP